MSFLSVARTAVVPYPQTLLSLRKTLSPASWAVRYSTICQPELILV